MKTIMIIFLLVFCLFFTFFFIFFRKCKKTIHFLKIENNKFRNINELLNTWIRVKQQGKKIDSYFVKRNYLRIAVYGMGAMGWRFIDELEGSGLKVECVIDKNANKIFCEQPIFFPDEDIPCVDVVVVTAFNAFDEVNKMFLKSNIDVVTLEEVLMDL